ncbi:MAG: hypothetical protein EZS28_029421 [Streblomastix strix]|uniref:Uncharacterized protein n=1 Tax=Streblomastix strix TaxID=222440 RepID=A0A5J4UXU9_9EUKA|nr:MAG: hypothetical protein EZS28_029421 [Streblomastix strix]
MLFRADLERSGYLPQSFDLENQKDLIIISSKITAIKKRIITMDNRITDIRNNANFLNQQNQKEQAVKKLRVAKLLQETRARVQSQVDLLEQQFLSAQREIGRTRVNYQGHKNQLLSIIIIREMNDGIAAGNNAIFNNAGINDDDCLDELQRHSTPYGWK